MYVCTWGEEGDAEFIGKFVCVSSGVPARKSRCRWIRVFRYICSYLQTGKYKFTTTNGYGCECVCVCAFSRREEKKEGNYSHNTRPGYLCNFIKINRSSVFYCRSVISFSKTDFFFFYFSFPF